jgi:hypothetical protein
VLGEDVEYQPGAVDDLETPFGERVDAGKLFEVAALGRCQLVVEDEDPGVERAGEPDDLLGLAATEVGGRVGAVPALYDAFERVRAGGVGQRLELVERPLGLLRGRGSKGGADEDGPLPLGRGGVTGRLPAQVTTLRRRSTPSSSRSSSSVKEKRTNPSPEGP